MMSDIRAAVLRASGFVAGVALLTCATGVGGAAAANYTCTWVGTSGNDWTQAANWQSCNGSDPSNSGGATYDATIGFGGFADLSGATITVGNVTLAGGVWALDSGASASLTGNLANEGGTLYLDSQSTLDVAGSMTNSGDAYINSDGGSGLTVTGNLLDSGYLAVGGGGNFGTVTAGTLSTAGGYLQIDAGAAGASTVTVQSAAPGILEGSIELVGSATEGAVLAYQSGGITQIGDGAGGSYGYLRLDGATAAVESGGQSGNSALLGLTAVASNGTLEIDDGASVATGSGTTLTNDGNIYVGSIGGGSLTVGGALSSAPLAYIQVGNSALASGSAATMSVGGLNDTSGANAWDSNLSVISGQGTAIFATGNTLIKTLNGQISIDGPQAYVALNAGDASNTALASLSAVSGYLDLENGASLTTTTGLTLSNDGEVDVDSSGPGGSKLVIGGALTLAPTSGYIFIGNSGLAAGQSSTMSVGGLSSSTLNGWLGLAAGNGTASFITGGSGIDAIAAGGGISLDGGTHGAAYLELSKGDNSNSALASLSSIGAAASLDLENGESVTTTGGLTNSGYITIDQYASGAGSSLTVNGVLTDTPALDPYGSGRNVGGITIGNGANLSNSTLTVAGMASGTAGANVLDGNVYVEGGGSATGPNGVAALVISNGANGITGIAGSGNLYLANGNSLVELASQEGSNSALSTLASNAGSLYLANGSAVSTTPAGGTFTNTGSLTVWSYGVSPSSSSFAVTGSLANQGGGIYLGGGGPLQSSTLSVSADLSNTGDVAIDAFGTASVGGTYSNSGPLANTTVSGTLDAASIGNSGTLQGTGVINGNVTSSGLIDAGSSSAFSPGTLSINGNLTQTSGGTLAAAVYDLNGDSSLITASGSASLAGRLSAYIIPGLTLAPGDAVTLLTAQNGISGNLGSLQVSYDGTSSLSAGPSVIVDGGTTLSSTVSGNSLELTAATTANQDNWTASGNGNWSGAANWSAGGPGASSNVAVPLGTNSVTVTLDDSPTVNSLIVGPGNTLQYASGTPETLTASNIVTVDSGATLSMTTAGDSLKTASNALNVSGTLDAENGASVQAAQALIGGLLQVDSNPLVGSAGDSSATITGTLYDSGGVLSIGNSGITTGSTVTAAGFSNAGSPFGAAVELTGSASAQALLDITGPSGSFQPVAQGVLSSGEYYLTGDAALEYSGTPIVTIGGGAMLVLNGSQGQILANGSNALTGLTSNQGTLELDNGAALTSSSFSNTGQLNLGDPQLYLPDGQQLTNLQGGSLTVTGPAGSFSSVSSGGQLYEGSYYVGPGGTLTFNNGGAGISSIAQSASLTLDGSSASIVDSGAGSGVNSALNGLLATNYGALTLEHGATLAVGNFENQGTLGLIGGTLNVGGTFNSIDQEIPDTFGASAENALYEGTLVVSSVNADGTAAGNAALVLNGQPIQEIGRNATLVVNGANATVALAGQSGSNSALASLSENEGTLEIDNGAAVAGSQLENRGNIILGGGSLTLSGAFQSISSQGTLYEGNLTVSSDYLVNPANYDGGAGQTSILERSNVGSGMLTYNGPALTAIGSGATLALVGANASVMDGASNALATLSSNAGTLDFELGAAQTLGSLTNSGTLRVDGTAYDTPYGGVSGNGLYLLGSGTYVAGGSTLTLTGALENSGVLQVGNGALTSASTLEVSDFANTGATYIQGSSSSNTPALVDVTGAFQSLTGAGELASGQYFLSGDAQLEYSGTAIGAIGPGVLVSLDGPGADLELAGQTGSNSALAALTANAGTLELNDGASVTTASGARLTNTGSINVDANAYGASGSSLTLGGLLTNAGSVSIGNAGMQSGETSTVSIQGLADANGNPTNTWTGYLAVTSGGGTAALVTQGAPIEAIGPGAEMFLNGAGALIKNSAGDGSSTALANLGSNAGVLYLNNGATVATAAGVNLFNSGTLAVDAYYGSSGSSLSVGGGLYSYGGSVQIGNSGLVASAGSSLSVDGLVDASGNPTTTWDGYLNVTSGSGTAALVTGGQALTAIDSGSSINLNGAGAYIENAAGENQSTALADFSGNAGTLALNNGATVATAAGVGLENSGAIYVDDVYGSGSSSLSVGGLLANSGYISVGNSGLANGAVSTMSVQGLLDAGGNPTNTWDGYLTVSSGQGTAAFATGTAITAIDSSSYISLDGPGAYVEQTPGDGGSTALGALGSNAGYLYLNDGASVATATGTNLVNSGFIAVDDSSGSSGSNLSVGGTLADQSIGPYGYYVYGQISIGNSGMTQGEASTMSVDGLTDANGNPTNSWNGFLTVTSGQGTAALVTNTAITSIGSGSISLDGPGAYVEQSAGDGGSTALASLGSNAGGLYLEDGASLTTVATNLVNTGELAVDDIYGSGGSSLTVGGALGNTGYILVGNSGLANGATSTLSMQGLEDGSGNPTNTWSGSVDVTSGQGTAALVTNTAITSIGSGSISLDGPAAYMEQSAGDGRSTALASLGTNTGSLYLNDGASLTTVSTNLVNAGRIGVDDNYGSGGSSLTVGGLLGNTGYISVGNSSLANGAISTMTVQGLEDGSGNPTNTWNGSLDVTSGQGTASFVTGGVAINQIAASSDITIDGAAAYVENGSADNGNTALAALNSIGQYGSLSLEDGASVVTSGALANAGYINVDDNYGSGGSSLTVGGVLTNTGTIAVGNANLPAGESSALSAQGLGSTTWNGSLSVTSGQGAATFVTGNAPIDAVASGGEISLDGPAAFVESGAGDNRNSALTALSSNAGYLYLNDGAQVSTVGTGLTNTGLIYIDDYGAGGSSLTVGGALANTGDISIGNFALASNESSTMSVQGLLDSSQNATTTWSGYLDVTSGQGTAAFVTGNAPIDAIGSGGAIYLDGQGAYVEEGSGDGANSALAALSSNAGTLSLNDGATVTTVNTGLTNTGNLYVDDSYGSGGSSLTVGGALANTGYVSIGNSGLGAGASSIMTVQALDDTSQNPTSTWNGDLTVSSGSGTAALVTGSGEISAIGSGAQIDLNGPAAFVEGSATDFSNSALTTLNSNAGYLDLYDGASVSSTAASLVNTGVIQIEGEYGFGGSQLASGGTLSNSGALYVDTDYAAGGSRVTAAGALTNTGTILIGNSGLALGASSTVSVQGLDDSSGNPTSTWSGSLTLRSGQGTAALIVGNAQIGSIASGAQIYLDGSSAYLENGATNNGNTALGTLASNQGNLYLYDGASVQSTAGSLANTGTIDLQGEAGYPGSSLGIAGGLNNSGSLIVDTDYAAGGSSVTAGGALTDTGVVAIGNAGLASGASSTVSVQGLNDTSGNPTSTWSGDLTVTSGQGTAALILGNAQIATIASGASVSLDGSAAYVENSAKDNGNTALAALVSNAGELSLNDGAVIQTTGTSLTNTGTLYVDDNYGSGGSGLMVGGGTGSLTNGGSLYIGNAGMSAPAAVTAGTLTNNTNATIEINGNSGVAGGTLTAANLVNGGSVYNYGGYVNVGGATSAQGGFAMGSAATMTELVGGIYSGEYGTVYTTGNVQLAGTLSLQTINGFSFAANETFNLISLPTTAGALSGTFGSLDYGACTGSGSSPLVCGGLQYSLSYDQGSDGQVILAVTNAPLSNEDDWVGTTDTWNNATDNSTNWSDRALPTTAQNVKVGLGVGGTVTYNDTNDTVSSLTVEQGMSSGYTLAFDPGDALTATNGVTIDSGGEIDVGTSGAALDTSTLTNTGGTLQIGGNGGGTVTVTPTTAGTGLSNGGTIDVNAGGTLALNDTTLAGSSQSGTYDNTSTGTISMAGGSITGVNGTEQLANEGTISGYGTVAPQIANSGTVSASGGTLSASSGIAGATGTVQTANGGTLAIGASSTAGTLANNGTLALGSNSITVSSDYTNANFGTGNGFNAHADVTGSGQILAARNAALSVTGSQVTGGTTSTPTLALGNVHVGTSTTASYSINNTGTTGPSIRGAVQNTGITDASVTVAAANYGPLAAGASQTESVSYDPQAAGALSGQSFAVASNFDNVGTKTVSVTGAAYDYASPVVGNGQTVDVGNFHVGTAPTQVAVPVSNAVITNASYQEGLDASVAGTSGSATSSGSISLLSAGGSSGAITVGVNGATAGVESGSVTLNLTSDGQGTSGLGTTALNQQSVTVTGTGYNLAQSSTVGPIDFGVIHAGTGVQTQTISITNTAPTGSYTEGLDSSFGAYTNNGGSLNPTFSGAITNLAGGSTDSTSMTVSLSTATAGVVSGNIAILQDSNGTIDGLGNTQLPTQNPAVSGTVEAIVTNLAKPQINNAPISFGNVRIGTTVTTQGLSVTNAAPISTYSEGLIASVAGSSGGATATGGFGSAGNSLAAGQSNSSGIQIGIDTASAGQVNGTAIVDFKSDGTAFQGGTVTDLGNADVGVTGTVYRLATGSAQDVNLGATRLNGTLAGTIAVTNTAATDGYSENLDASISGSTPAVSGASGTVTGLAAGSTDGSSLKVALNTATSGNIQGTATVQYQSDGTGIDNGAPVDNGSSTVNVTGKVYTPAVAQVNTQSVNFGIVHVGDNVATQAVSVSNVAPTTATSLNDVLQGALTSVSGPFTAQGNVGTGNAGVTAGGTDASSLQVGLDTSQAGGYSGTATFAGTSHDQDLADVAAQTQGSPTVSLSGQVNNYANAAFALDSGGTLTQNGSSYLLDLGNLTQNSSVSAILLSVLNDVAGPQQYTDYLQGSFTPGTLSDLSLQGSGWSSGFMGLEAGQGFGGSGVLGLAVDTASLGSFTDTIDLSGLGYYPGTGTAYSYADNISLTVEGDIVNASNVPEPASLPLFLGAGGLLALALLRRRQRARVRQD